MTTVECTSRGSGDQVSHDQRGRGRRSIHEPEERAEVPRG
jgi:hypothetical protein